MTSLIIENRWKWIFFYLIECSSSSSRKTIRWEKKERGRRGWVKTLSQEDSSSARANKQTNKQTKTKGEKFEPKTIKRSLETKLQKRSFVKKGNYPKIEKNVFLSSRTPSFNFSWIGKNFAKNFFIVFFLFSVIFSFLRMICFNLLKPPNLPSFLFCWAWMAWSRHKNVFTLISNRHSD